MKTQTLYALVRTPPTSSRAKTTDTFITRSLQILRHAYPLAGLIADAHGDLFGTTYGGGANGYGTVFEIAKTAHGYASTPTTLVNFNYANGGTPAAGLIADAHGDLFGTTYKAGRMATARYSRSPRPLPATPAPPSP